jgi:multiple sugar transport system permease protein
MKKTPYIFLSSFLILFAIFFILPLFVAIYTALYASRGPNMYYQFVGPRNFLKGITDIKLWEALINIWIFTLIWIPILLVTGLALSIYVYNRNNFWSRLLLVVAFLPYAVPTVIGSILWGFMYNPTSGGLTYVFSLFNLKINLLKPESIMIALVNIIAWEYLGFNTVILLSGLRSIPTYIYEAAIIDGATLSSIIKNIQIPLIKKYLYFIVATTIIGAQLLFNEPYILGRIAPIQQNFTPNTYIYYVIKSTGNLNYAASLSLVIGVVSIISSFVLFRRIMRGD